MADHERVACGGAADDGPDRTAGAFIDLVIWAAADRELRRIARDFGDDLRGADIAFASDIPIAAGLSSSSALVVATFLALAHVNSLALEPMERLAGYLGAVENGSAFGDFAGDSGVGSVGDRRTPLRILVALQRIAQEDRDRRPDDGHDRDHRDHFDQRKTVFHRFGAYRVR